MKYIITILALFLSANFALAQQEEQKVMEHIRTLTKAIFEKRDSAVLLKLVGEKVTYGHSNGNIENKTAMIHNAMVSPTTYQDFRMENATVFIEGNTAIARHDLKARTFDQQGKEGVLNLNVLQTWVKRKNEWVLVARQAVRLP